VLLITQKRIVMTTKEIKTALLEGKNFGNELANWYSVCKPSENLFWIVIAERNLFCKNIESAAKRISQLIKRGY
jgi:hypothetical protein